MANCVLCVFGGFLIPNPPVYWSWLPKISYVTYAYQVGTPPSPPGPRDCCSTQCAHAGAAGAPGSCAGRQHARSASATAYKGCGKPD